MRELQHATPLLCPPFRGREERSAHAEFAAVKTRVGRVLVPSPKRRRIEAAIADAPTLSRLRYTRPATAPRTSDRSGPSGNLWPTPTLMILLSQPYFSDEVSNDAAIRR